MKMLAKSWFNVQEFSLLASITKQIAITNPTSASRVQSKSKSNSSEILVSLAWSPAKRRIESGMA